MRSKRFAVLTGRSAPAAAGARVGGGVEEGPIGAFDRLEEAKAFCGTVRRGQETGVLALDRLRVLDHRSATIVWEQ